MRRTRSVWIALGAMAVPLVWTWNALASPSGEPGVAVSDKIEIKGDAPNGRLIPWSSHGVAAARALISTNSTDNDKIKAKEDGYIDADVLIGVGGDPNDVIKIEDDGVITGTISALTSPIVIPAYNPPTIGNTTGDLKYKSGTTTISADVQCDKFEIESGAIVEISGEVHIHATDDIKLKSGGELRILPCSTLYLYADKDIDLEDDSKMNTYLADPQRLVIEHKSSKFEVTDTSVMYATVLSPDEEMKVKDDARFYGTFKGKKFKVEHDAIAYIDTWQSQSIFTDVSSTLGFNVQTTAGSDASAWHWADLDDDGDLDAIATGDNLSRVFRNTNAGQSFFVSTFGTGNHPFQMALADFDNDGDVDGYHVDRSHFDNSGGTLGDQGAAGMVGPVGGEGVVAVDLNWDGFCDLVVFATDANWIGLNDGTDPAAFTPSSHASWGLNDAGDFGDGEYVSAADVNDDGFLDFFYHYGTGKLFLSDGDGSYTENPGGISVVTGASDKMGSAWGDYDNDGDMDLYVPRVAEGNPGYLWRNDGATFTDVTAAANIDYLCGQRSATWGDYDNDGHLDLFIVTVDGNDLLYQNQGDGTFALTWHDIDESTQAHDAVFVDYDNDGDLDLAISRQDGDAILLRNDTDNTNYLKVRVVGAGSGGTNTAGVGVRVDLYASDGTTFIARREIGTARGFGGTEPLWVHFGGINPASTYVVKAHLLSGIEEVTLVPNSTSTTIGATTINQMLTITETLDPTLRVLQWHEAERQ